MLCERQLLPPYAAACITQFVCAASTMRAAGVCLGPAGCPWQCSSSAAAEAPQGGGSGRRLEQRLPPAGDCRQGRRRCFLDMSRCVIPAVDRMSRSSNNKGPAPLSISLSWVWQGTQRSCVHIRIVCNLFSQVNLTCHIRLHETAAWETRANWGTVLTESRTPAPRNGKDA